MSKRLFTQVASNGTMNSYKYITSLSTHRHYKEHISRFIFKHPLPSNVTFIKVMQ